MRKNALLTSLNQVGRRTVIAWDCKVGAGLDQSKGGFAVLFIERRHERRVAFLLRQRNAHVRSKNEIRIGLS